MMTMTSDDLLKAAIVEAHERANEAKKAMNVCAKLGKNPPEYFVVPEGEPCDTVLIVIHPGFQVPPADDPRR
jgi:hypothetical protein